MYAIGLQDGDCIGLVSEPFNALEECLDFIVDNNLDELHDVVFILESRYYSGVKQKEVK